MRAIIATLVICLCAVLSPASAHVYHPVHPMVRVLGSGFIHMMRSAERHHVVVHRVTHRHAEARHSFRRVHTARLRKFAQPRLDGMFLPFEPGPFSMLFGAGQTAVQTGIDAGIKIAAESTSTASNIAVGVAAHLYEGVSRVIGYRPADCRGIPWCGCYMRHLMGVSDPSYNLARKWAGYGHATSPHVGAIVVWPHHVGKIVGQHDGQWIVLSGNDGHAVRSRARSLAGAIAFRE